MSPLPLPESLADVLTAWRERGRALGHSERTIESRIYTIGKLAADGYDPLNATPAELEHWLANHPKLKRSSRGTYRAQLRSWYEFLQQTDRRLDDPTVKLGTMKVPPGLPRPLSHADAAALLAACEDPRTGNTRAYVTLALFAGLRNHEIAKVRGEDFGSVYLHVVGKGSKEGQVPINPAVAELVEQMPQSGYWFPTSPQSRSDLPHVHRVTVGLAIKRAMTRAGVVATPHACRHYFATSVLAVSTLQVAQKALRHSNISSTTIYARLPDEEVVAAVARIGRPRPAA